MLATIPVYLAMGDGGFTSTSCRDITMQTGKGNRHGAIAVYQSTWVLLLCLSLVIGFVAVIFSWIVPLHQWLQLTTMTEKETSLVFLILVGDVLLSFQGGLLNAGFWATGNYPKSMFFVVLLQLFDFCGMSLAITLRGGPVQVALGFFLGGLIGTTLMWREQRKVCPWLTYGFQFATLKEIRRLVAPSFASLAFPLGNALNIQGVRLVIGLVLGPSAVATFVTLRTLSNFVIQPRQVINRLTEPEMALAFGTGDKPLYLKLFLESVRICFWSCLAVAVLLIPMSLWIFPIWTFGQISIHWPTFLFLLAAAVTNSIWYSALMVAYSTNRHGSVALIYFLIYGFTGIVLIYLFTKMLGLSGAAVALFMIEIAMGIMIVQQAIKLSEISVGRFLATLSIPPIKEIASGLSSAYLYFQKQYRKK